MSKFKSFHLRKSVFDKYRKKPEKCSYSFWGMKSLHLNLIGQCWVTEEAAQREEIKCYMGCEPDVNPQLQKSTGKPIITSSSVEANSSLSQSLSTHHSHTADEFQGLDSTLAQVQGSTKVEKSKWRWCCFSPAAALCRCGRHCDLCLWANSEASMQMWSKMVEVN